MNGVGKLIIALGLLLVIVGLVVIVSNKTLPLGRLPGDFTIERENLRFYFPVTTGLLVSSVLSGLAFLILTLF
ncbi:hypothetical protein A2757_01795 [Candidatus Giovannonibacteria bacterium RIFCSPHIGHO2_01_FULL_48_47]|nr:MAG: hypothetical protein A2757_01795 [Candidatus Giovannonibacteria bacterium RIFCSPHIGHO2_01_FULL_48_47]OGF68436.1 MAG: hypothetical protein A3D61_00990 [Candidatus Giovannonibacteria bacterium RIFCSPHIGHO2_02_FULL_48_15]OGF88772.1 MAG: hypothetical protein A3B26_03080 [Candidatus Giovannonibacteria bacterium RIFCSPLOWO2_01_FULL_48_47]OGF96107.1 MAG: hypothetical protein A2613_00875 [Candidatus Giovannonibacteria bacterium RIFOXYD1_FULL_48_21]HBT81370.1 DUF2905 domain-containing protein [C